MYIDVFFVLNGWMDLLLLSMAGELWERKVQWGRKIAGAITGATGACLFLLLPTNSVLVRLGFGVLQARLMVGIAYAPLQKGEGWKLTGTLYGMAMILNGGLDLFSEWLGSEAGSVSFLLLAGGWYGVMKVGLHTWRAYRKRQKYRMQALLVCGETRVVIPALWDTGNHLHTYEGQRPVHVAEREAVVSLLGDQPSYHVVPYQAVGTETGALLAVTIDRMVLQQGDRQVTVEQPVIGLYEKTLSPKGEYRLLLHADTPV